MGRSLRYRMSNKVQNVPRGLSHDGLSLTLQERLWRAPHPWLWQARRDRRFQVHPDRWVSDVWRGCPLSYNPTIWHTASRSGARRQLAPWRPYRGVLWGIAGLFIVLFIASALAAPAENRDDLLKLPESLSGAEPSPKIPPSEVLITTADDILGEMVNLKR